MKNRSKYLSSENNGDMYKAVLKYLRQFRKPVAILSNNTWTTIEFAERYKKKYNIFKIIGEKYISYLNKGI